MIGWQISVFRNGTVIEGRFDPQFKGEELLYEGSPFPLGQTTPLGQPEATPPSLEDKAEEVISSSGYPSIMRIKAGNLPYELDVPGDEVVFLVAWDQS